MSVKARVLITGAALLTLAGCADFFSSGNTNTLAVGTAFQSVPAGFSANSSSFDASGDTLLHCVRRGTHVVEVDNAVTVHESITPTDLRAFRTHDFDSARDAQTTFTGRSVGMSQSAWVSGNAASAGSWTSGWHGDSGHQVMVGLRVLRSVSAATLTWRDTKFQRCRTGPSFGRKWLPTHCRHA